MRSVLGVSFSPFVLEQLTKFGRAVPMEPWTGRLVTGTPAGTDMKFTVDEGEEISALGERYEATPMVLPVRGIWMQ